MFIYNLQEMAKNLQSDYEKLSSKITHNGLKGTVREEKLKEYITKLFPTKYAIGNGIIVDSNETQSKQQDFIIYDNFNSPKLMETESVQIVPIESVYATIEVKSTLTINELEKCINNIRSVKTLKKIKPLINPIITSNIPCPISMIFAYSSDTSIENIVKNLDTFNQSIPYNEQVNLVCILDKGLIYSVNKYGFKDLTVFPNENTILVSHEDKIENNLYLFYLIIMSVINNIILPPVNLMAYAQKINKADYSFSLSSDRIPKDGYYNIVEGFRSKLTLMQEATKKFTERIEEMKKGNYTKEQILDHIEDLYDLSLDPYFTGNSISNSNGISWYGINITSNELLVIKQYNHNQIELTEDLENLINKIYTQYKSNYNKVS